MTVTASCTVQTSPRTDHAPSATWPELTAPEVVDRWTEYLVLPELVAPPEDFAARAAELAAAATTPGEAAHAVCELVRTEVEYRSGTTDAGTVAASAWEQRSGVCQDMVHLALGGLRSVGIPARYVSGYFHPSLEPVVGETVAGASHAWVEWWDQGWRPFDVTTGAQPDERYVVVAAGRDYDDVKPISGIYSGAETTAMDVEVELTRLT